MKSCRAKRLCHANGAPLYGGVRDFVPPHELVFRRAPGELSGTDDKPSAAGETALPALNCVFQQLRRPQIPMGDIDVMNSMMFQPVPAGANSGVSDRLVVVEHLFPVSPDTLYRNMVS